MNTTRTYNPSVRIGNWNEDIQLEEDTVKDFLERRERGELLIQKSASYSGICLKQGTLSTVTDGLLHIGDQVLLVNPMNADRNKYFADVDPRDESVLSINIMPSQLQDLGCIGGNCGVTSSARYKDPVARNVFVIEGTPSEGSAPKSPLRYGQPFYLKTSEAGGNLYMSSDHKTFQRCTKKARNQEVCLVTEPSFLTEWKLESRDPQFRLETEGTTVPANAVVLIKHCKTNQALSVEENFKVKTLLGFEYEVSAHTSLDSHKAEQGVNHWVFRTANALEPSVAPPKAQPQASGQ